ncbi:MAG: FxsA family protein [Methylovirgula sp.]
MPYLAAFFLSACLWVLAEVSVFGLVADAVGLAGAVVLTVLFSLLGLTVLRRLGGQARDVLKAALNQPSQTLRLSPLTLRSGAFAAIGAALLVVPGFLSDCVGLALLLPAWRHQELAPKPPASNTIDLTPQDWHRID